MNLRINTLARGTEEWIGKQWPAVHMTVKACGLASLDRGFQSQLLHGYCVRFITCYHSHRHHSWNLGLLKQATTTFRQTQFKPS